MHSTRLSYPSSNGGTPRQRSNSKSGISSGILQCKKCWSFISTTSRVESLVQIDNEIFIVISNDPPLNSVDSDYQPPSLQLSQSSSSLCVVSSIACRNCRDQVGVVYYATTEQFDCLRQKPLLKENSVQYQDAETCEICKLSSVFQSSIVQINSQPSRDMNQQRFSRTTSPAPPPNSVQSKRSDVRSTSKGEEKRHWQLDKVKESAREFADSLVSFDHRIGVSEVHIDRMNKNIIEIHKLLQQQRQQQPLRPRFDSPPQTTQTERKMRPTTPKLKKVDLHTEWMDEDHHNHRRKPSNSASRPNRLSPRRKYMEAYDVESSEDVS